MEGDGVIQLTPNRHGKHVEIQTDLSYDDHNYGHYFDGFPANHPSNLVNGTGKGGVLLSSVRKKIDKGPLFYVVSNNDQLKFGISSVNGRPRLSTHGSYWRDSVLNAAIKFKGVRSGTPRILENMIKKFFGSNNEKMPKSNLPTLLSKLKEFYPVVKRMPTPKGTRTGLRSSKHQNMQTHTQVQSPVTYSRLRPRDAHGKVVR
jgi:hypothetical protein